MAGAARTPLEPSRRSALELLVVPLVVGLVVAASRLPILTPDVWWHLATGRLVQASGIPHSDPFSYTLVGQRWIPHEWLADLVLYGIHARAGLLGIVLGRGVLIGAAFACAYAAARVAAGPLPALAVLVPAAYATQRNWLDRPQLVSYVAVAFLLWVLARPGRRWFGLPILFAVWVNLHGGFMIGLAMVGWWTAARLLTWSRTRSAADAATVRRLSFVFALCLLATLANPNGFGGATYPLHYVRSGIAATVQEEQPGDLDSPFAWVHLVLVVALWGSFLVRRRASLAEVGLGVAVGWISMPRLGGVALPFAAERHAPLFLLVGAPLLAWQLSLILRSRSRAWDERWRPWLAARRTWGIAAGVTAAAAFGLLALLPRDGSSEARLLPGRYPEAAAAWLRAARLPGNLVNPYRWGGYLLFTLYPPTQVWIDSRGDLYGAARLEEYELLHHAPPGSDAALRALLQRYDANVVVWPLVTVDFGAPRVHPFTEYLLRSGEWRLVFYDRPDARRPQRPAAVAAVFLREDPRNAAWLAQHAPVRLPRLPRGSR